MLGPREVSNEVKSDLQCVVPAGVTHAVAVGDKDDKGDVPARAATLPTGLVGVGSGAGDDAEVGGEVGSKPKVDNGLTKAASQAANGPPSSVVPPPSLVSC